MSVKQRDTDPNNNRYYWAVSSNGNSLSRKAAADGGTVSWTSVASSNYTFRTRTVSDQNCNGILPGLGNATLPGPLPRDHQPCRATLGARHGPSLFFQWALQTFTHSECD